MEQKNVQVYDKPDELPIFFTLEEIAITSYLDDVLKVSWKWLQRDENTTMLWTTPGSYTFSLNKLNDRVLIFSRTNDEDVPEEGRVQTNFEARYHKVSWVQQNIWTGNELCERRK